MDSLFIYYEILTNGSKSIILDMITVSAILSGILVIIGKNPIISVLFLIGLFLSMASYLLEIGLGFIGISYLLVYVGAVSILFLFILMLLNVRVSELIGNTSNSLFLTIFISMSFYYPIANIEDNKVISSTGSFITKIISYITLKYFVLVNNELNKFKLYYTTSNN